MSQEKKDEMQKARKKRVKMKHQGQADENGYLETRLIDDDDLLRRGKCISDQIWKKTMGSNKISAVRTVIDIAKKKCCG